MTKERHDERMLDQLPIEGPTVNQSPDERPTFDHPPTERPPTPQLLQPPTLPQNPLTLLQQPELPRDEGSPIREKSINKLTPFDRDRRKIITFIQECCMYLQINKRIYTMNKDKVAFVLSYMMEKEALKWKQTYLRSIINNEGEIIFPTFKQFISTLDHYFKPVNRTRDTAHQLKILKQGKKTAKEVIMEFRLLVAEAGYSSNTRTDNLHLIEKLQDILNPSLTKKILLSKKVPDTVEEWAQKAIDIDSNYRSALEILGKYASKTTPPRTTTPPRATFNYRKREE